MKKNGFLKSPAYSLVELKGRVHMFFAGDKSLSSAQEDSCLFGEIIGQT